MVVVAQVESAPRAAEHLVGNEWKREETEITVEIGKIHQIDFPPVGFLGRVDRLRGTPPALECADRIPLEATIEKTAAAGGQRVETNGRRIAPVVRGMVARSLGRGRADPDDPGPRPLERGGELGEIHRMMADPKRIDQRHRDWPG